jgi:CheY-like chemotaxis protein
MLTAAGSPVKDNYFAEKGFSAYLSKPVRAHALIETLALVWESYSQGNRHAMIHVDPHALGKKYQEDKKYKLPDAHILIAEDNLVNQTFIRKTLEEMEADFTIVANGREALDAIAQQGFDLVIMDCLMPVMDGFQASREITRRKTTGEITGELPIIALTANAMQGDRERCLAEGMQGYVPKPVNPQVLYREIDRVMADDQPEQQKLPSHPGGRPDDFLEQSRLESAAEFDWDLALNNLGADASLLYMALQMFVDEYPEHKAQLHAAWQSGDRQALSAVAHTLKSLLATFAAYPAQKQAERLERLAKQSADQKELKPVLDKLQKYLDVLLPLLQKQLQNQ